MEPLAFVEYVPFTIPLEKFNLEVKFVGDDSKPIAVSQPKKTQMFLGQKSYEPTEKVDLSSFGPTSLVPLGLVAHAR